MNKIKPLDGLPLFKTELKRRLERVGVVDVGSNSVRLVVFDGAARSPAYFFNEKILCGLGAGVAETGRLNPEGRARAMQALKRFALLAKGMNTGPLNCVATAAVREAEDGDDFVKAVKKETGLRLKIASGKEEARLSAQGVLLGWPGADGVMCDIGGSSMELAEISNGQIDTCLTSELGPQRLAGFEGDALDAEIRLRIKELRRKIPGTPRRLYLVGGSWRAIARLDMERREYPLKVLHEYMMRPSELLETVDWIGAHSIDELRAMTGASAARMTLVPVASRVLAGLLECFKPEEIAVSSYGIREGLLYEQMPKRLRKRDPLIEACQHMELASARIPGFGGVLADFLSPVFQHQDKAQKRLVHAACLLHDVTWRAHPDYRAEVCFDNATRANLGGLNHAGRVFLGYALLNRYKNSSVESTFDPVMELLTPEERRDAEILGRAMRFGAMLSGALPEMMGQLTVDREARKIELALPAEAAELYGEVVRTRYESLARSMEFEPLIRLEEA